MKKITFTLLLYFFLSLQANAINFFWVGGTGNWTDLNHWATTSGGVIHPVALPGTGDDVFFNALSFSAASQKVSLTADAVCRSMNWTGVTNNPTLEFTGSSGPTLRIYGSLTLVIGMSVTYPVSGRWEFWSPSTGNTITTAGKQMQDVTTRGDGGGWTLQDNLNAAQQVGIFYGIFNTNNVTINTGTFVSATGCGGCNNRTVNLGSSIISCSVQWNIFGDAGMTLNTGTSTIRTPGFTSTGNATYYNAEMNGSGVNGVVLSGTIVFNNFDFTAGTALSFSGGLGSGSFTATNRLGLNRPGSTITFISGSTITANGILDLPNPGAGCSALTTLQTIIPGSPVTISKSSGSVVSSRMSIKDITATGGATFTANQSVDQGGNSGWTINAPAASSYYWVGGTGNWNDGNHWSTSSGGAASGCVPSLLDDVFFNALSFSAASQKVSLTADAVCRSMNWTGVTNNPTLEFTGSSGPTLRIYGSLTLVIGMSVTYPVSGRWEFWSPSTGNTITTAGKQMQDVTTRGDGGGWTLQDNLNAAQQVGIFYGIFNTNNVTINTGTFVSATGCGGCNNRTVNLGSSIISCSVQWNIFGDAGMTLNTGTSTIRTPGFTSTGNATYYNAEMNGSGVNGVVLSGTIVFNNFDFTAGTALSFSGGLGSGSFTATNRLGLNRPGSTITFISGSTITANGILDLPNPGAGCSALTTLQTIIPGSPVTISKSSGSVVSSRMSIKDITATGGATFTANQSVDQGGNSGWTINAPAASSYYWVGGTGNWNDGNHWSTSSGGAASGCVPSLLDDVFFNALSFSAASQKVSLTADAVCRSMNWTGVTNNPTLEFTGSSGPTLRIYGSLTLVIGMSVTYPVSGRWEFWSPSTGNTITTAGKQMQDVTTRGDGGGWTLQDNLNAAQQVGIFYGIFNTNNVTINTGTFVSATGCGGCNNRTVNLGSSIISCSVQWNIFGDAGMTLNTGTSTIRTPGFTSTGNATYYNAEMNGSGVNGVVLSGTIVFNNFDFTAGTALSFSGGLGSGSFTATNRLGLNRPGSTITFNAGSTIIINGLLQLPDPGAVQTSVSGSAATINKSSGRICVSNVILKDLNASGGALFYASNSTNNGNNIGWNFTSQTCLAILPVQLLSFELGCITDKILFTWKTATEINSSHFEIQKQINNSWVTIGNVRASGESQSERTYQFQSTEQGGVYRLVSADLDGKKSYSAIRSLRCREIENISLVNNPVQNELNVQIKSIKNERMLFQIINSSGQVVRKEEIMVISGVNQHKFNLIALQSGMYILNVPSLGKKILFVKMK